jgi:hypothetical protein
MTVTDAALAVIQAAVPAGVTVYDGAVPGIPPARYVVLYGDTGWRTSTGWDGLARDESYTIQVTTVASAGDSLMSAGPLCRALAQRVRDALVDVVLTVPGLICGPVTHSLSNPPQVDEAVKDRPTVYAVDQFSILATRV